LHFDHRSLHFDHRSLHFDHRSLPFGKLRNRLSKGLLSGRLDEKVASTGGWCTSTSSVAACRTTATDLMPEHTVSITSALRIPLQLLRLF
jgi:hypothetical protein